MDKSAWITLGAAILFRLIECIKKVTDTGKFSIIAVIKEFLQIS